MLYAVQVTWDNGDWGQEQNRKVVIAQKPSLGQMPNETQRGVACLPQEWDSRTNTGTITHCLAP